MGAQLAGPRATVRVLALLPLIGLGMGLLMGADPVGFLLGTPWGWACLVLAALLEAAGTLLDASSRVRDRGTPVSVVLLCFGVWLLFTASRGRVLAVHGHRPTVSGPLAASLLAGVGTVLLLGGPWGLACGVAVAVGARWLLRRLSRGESPRHEQVVRIAPEAVECIAACVAAGAPLWAAMSSVAGSVRGSDG